MSVNQVTADPLAQRANGRRADEGKTAQPPTGTASFAADGGAPFSELAAIAGDALRIWPPLYLQSIFGSPQAWLPPYRRFSEYSLFNPWRPLRSTPPLFNPPFLDDLFWQPTVILQRPDHYGSYTSCPDEAWFLINGIMTNDAMAQINAALLEECKRATSVCLH